MLLGKARDKKVEVCICPVSYWPLGHQMSEAERKSLDDDYHNIRNYLLDLLQDKGIESIDDDNHGFRSTKWFRDQGALYLYQDARDPMFGTELALSIVKSKDVGPY